MRYLVLSSVLCLFSAACADDDAERPKATEMGSDKGNGGSGSKADAGPTDSDKDKDAGKDAGAANSSDARLPRPSLPRAPGKGLPEELRPPR